MRKKLARLYQKTIIIILILGIIMIPNGIIENVSYAGTCPNGGDHNFIYTRTEHMSGYDIDANESFCNKCNSWILNYTVTCQHHIPSSSIIGTTIHTSLGHLNIVGCDGDYYAHCGHTYTVGNYFAKADCPSCTTPPLVNIVSPLNETTYLSEKDTNYFVNFQVQDNENDNLTCRVFLDEITPSYSIFSVTGTQTIKLVTSPIGINIANLTEGKHSIRVNAKDSIAPKGTMTSYFYVDKTAPTISNLIATASSLSSGDISCKASDTLALDNNGFRYKLNGNWSDWTTTNLGNINCKINGSFIPNSYNTVYVEVKDKVGHVASTNTQFLTPAQVPNISLISSTTNSLTVKLNSQNPEFTEYSLKVGNMFVDYNGYMTPDETWVTPSDSSNTFIINGLSVGTNYQIKANARNRNQTATPYSDISNFSTATPAKVTNLTASAITDTTAYVSWGGVAGITNYRVFVDVFTKGNNLATLDITGTASPFYYLPVSSQIIFSVLPIVSNGQAELSSITFFTKKSMPSPVTGLKTTNNNAGKLFLEWNSSINAESYDIKIDGQPYLNNVTGTSVEITHPEPDKQVNISVVSKNSDVSCTTPASIITNTLSNQQSFVTISSISADQVSAKWSNNGNPDRVKYEVVVVGTTTSSIIVNTTNVAISGLTPDTNYSLRVRSLNTNNVPSTWGGTFAFKTFRLAPLQIENLITSSEDHTIDLNWTSDSRADYYKIRINGIEQTSNVTGNSFTLTNLVAETMHTIEVAGVNESGYGPWSFAITQHTLPEMPSTPTNIITTADMNSIRFDWDAVNFADGYEIRLGGNLYQNIHENTYTITGLDSGEPYSYEICARNESGRSDWSKSKGVSTKPLLPNIPEITSLNATDTIVYVNWNNELSATSYMLEVNGTIVNNNITGTSYSIPNLTANSNQLIRLCSINESGQSNWSDLKQIKTLSGPNTVPIINSISTKDSINVNWMPINNATGYDIQIDNNSIVATTSTAITLSNLQSGVSKNISVRAKFTSSVGAFSTVKKVMTIPSIPTITSDYQTSNTIKILLNDVQGASKFIIKIDGVAVPAINLTSYTTNTLSANKEYTFSVSAVNDAGQSDFSTPVIFKTKPAVSTVPTNVTTMNNGVGKTIIKWNPVNGVNKYKLIVDGITIAATQSLPEYNIEGVPGSIHTIRIASVINETTNALSSYTASKSFVLPAAIPVAPNNVSSLATSNSIKLTWIGIPGATGYTVNSNGNDIPLGNATTCAISGLTPNTNYNIKIKAFNNTGASDWSPNYNISTSNGVPTSPQNLIINVTPNETQSNTSVKISWSSIANATSYNILFDNTNYSVTANTITLDNIGLGTSHTAKVQANVGGLPSPWSSTINIYMPLQKTKNLIASKISGQMFLKWDLVSNAVSYEVEMDGKIIGTSTTASIVTEQVATNLTHQYRVRAIAPNMEGNWSDVYTFNQNEAVGIDIVQSQNLILSMPADVIDVNQYQMSMTYDTTQLQLSDACLMTLAQELLTQYNSEAKMFIEITRVGVLETIKVRLNIDNSTGNRWQGSVNEIKFTALTTGKTNIIYSVDKIK